MQRPPAAVAPVGPSVLSTLATQGQHAFPRRGQSGSAQPIYDGVPSVPPAYGLFWSAGWHGASQGALSWWLCVWLDPFSRHLLIAFRLVTCMSTSWSCYHKIHQPCSLNNRNAWCPSSGRWWPEMEVWLWIGLKVAQFFTYCSFVWGHLVSLERVSQI